MALPSYQWTVIPSIWNQPCTKQVPRTQPSSIHLYNISTILPVLYMRQFCKQQWSCHPSSSNWPLLSWTLFLTRWAPASSAMCRSCPVRTDSSCPRPPPTPARRHRGRPPGDLSTCSRWTTWPGPCRPWQSRWVGGSYCDCYTPYLQWI